MSAWQMQLSTRKLRREYLRLLRSLWRLDDSGLPSLATRERARAADARAELVRRGGPLP